MPHSRKFLNKTATCSLIVVGLMAGSALAGGALYDFAAFGSFKRMNHTGDTSGQVRLSALPQTAGTWGVGALAGLSGEILLDDGRVLVSRGEDHRGRVSDARPDDEAAIFASARVQQWKDVPVPKDMPQVEFETFVVEQAKKIGLDTEQPFPFLVDGAFSAITWHVVTGKASNPSSGTGGHTNKHAGMKVFEQSGVAGRLVAFYSSSRFEGVVSHPGERFHVHYVDTAREASGHVDAYRVDGGATLRLPANSPDQK